MLPTQENFLDHDSNSKPFGPFTILDLFVTTTIIAVAVGFQTAIYEQMPGYPSVDPAWMAFSKTIAGLMGGAFLTIPYWMYRIYRQCGRVLIHPGHFLMVYYAISFVMQIGFLCIYAFTSENQAADWSNVNTAIIAIEGVLLLAACVMALRTRESSEHGWRYFFIGLSFSAFLYLLGALFMVLGIQPRLGGLFNFFGLQIPGLDMMQVIYYLVLGIYVLLFIVCIVFDIRKKRKRDGVHWIGISLAALQGFLIPMLSQIYYYFFWQP